MLAALVNPALFAAGAGAVAIPIIIHLLARRRFKRIRWAAMDFLVDAERRNRRRINMEDWILLALRCLAVFLIGLLMARPFLPPSGLPAGWRGSEQTERIFVLDDSFSMGYESAKGTSFSKAKQAIRRLLSQVRQENPDDTVTLIRMSAVDSPVESGTYLDDEQTEEVLARLEALGITQKAADPPTVIEGVADILQQNSGIVNAAVYVLSDFQRSGWLVAESAAPTDSPAPDLLAPLARWASEKDRGLRIVMINVGDENAGNTAITELSIEAGRLVAGTATTLHTVIANHGERPMENLALQVDVGQIAQPTESLRDLAPRQQASLDIAVEFLRAGFEMARVEIPADPLPLDNVRYAVADVAHALRILVVNGEPSADEYDDEVTYLGTALRPEGEVFSGNEVVVIDEAQMDEAVLSEFHVVILANAYRISEPATNALEAFARNGGGVAFFLGDQVDADLYNSAFFRDGEGLLPGELIERVRPAEPVYLSVADRLHPTMRRVSKEGDPLGLGQIPFLEYFRVRAFEGIDEVAIPAVEGEQGVLRSAAARPSRVIASFGDGDDFPAILERHYGRGRVILFSSTADKEWHRWPDHPTYLPIMLELVKHIAKRTGDNTDAWVGAPIEFVLDPAVYHTDFLVRTPGYPAEGEVSVTAVPSSDGQGLVAKWDETEKYGQYQFVLTGREGGTTTKLVAVNLDPRESDLFMASEADLRHAMPSVPFEYVMGEAELRAGAGETRSELWRFCLVAAIVLLFGEQTLAWLWGRHR